METGVAVVILCEALAIIACVYGFKHEDKLIRIEHAFIKAVIWTLWEKITHKRVDYTEEIRRITK